MWRWEYGCFSGDTRCFDVYFGGSNVTLSEAKQKTCSGWFGLCVWPANVSLFVFMCVKIVCAYACVFVCVSGDICCVVGWELSAVGCESPRLRRWKPRSQPGLVGQEALALTTHRYKVTRASGGRCAQTARTTDTHTPRTYVSRTQRMQGGGGAKTQGHALRNKNKVKINQLADKTACCENKLKVLDVHTRTHARNLDSLKSKVMYNQCQQPIQVN